MRRLFCVLFLLFLVLDPVLSSSSLKPKLSPRKSKHNKVSPLLDLEGGKDDEHKAHGIFSFAALTSISDFFRPELFDKVIIVLLILITISFALFFTEVGMDGENFNLNNILSSIGIPPIRFGADAHLIKNIRTVKVLFACICLVGSYLGLVTVTLVGISRQKLQTINRPIQEKFSPKVESLLEIEEGTFPEEDDSNKDPYDEETIKSINPFLFGDNSTQTQEKIKTEKQEITTTTKAEEPKEDEYSPDTDIGASREKIQKLGKLIAEKLVKYGTVGTIKAEEMKLLMGEAGFKPFQANTLLQVMGSRADYSISDLKALQTRPITSPGIIFGNNFYIIGGAFMFFLMAEIILLSSPHFFDTVIGLGCLLSFGVILLFVYALVVKMMTSNDTAKEGLYELASFMFQAAIFKLSLLLLAMSLFALVYHYVMNKCRDGRSICANGAVPICTDTGLPPVSPTCSNGVVQCSRGDNVYSLSYVTAVCPEENIPGAILDASGHVLQDTGQTSPTPLSYALTNSTICHGTGFYPFLCNPNVLYAYAIPGVLTQTQNIVSRMATTTFTPKFVAIADKDTNCANPYHYSPYNVSSSIMNVYTPTSTTGKSVYQLCVKSDLTETSWKLVNDAKWSAYIIIAPEAKCEATNCRNSDFGSTMTNNFADSLYFSMITHSTTGFGDITPTSIRGQALVVLHTLAIQAVAALT